MDWQRIIVWCNGTWDEFEYIDGEEQVIHIPMNMLSLDTLLQEIHDFMETSPESVKYVLSYLANASNDKMPLESNADFARFVSEQKELVVYVTEKSNEDPVEDASDQHHDLEELSAEEEENEGDDYSSELRRSLIIEFCGWIREPGRIDKFVKFFEDGGYHNLSSSTVHDDILNATKENVDDLCLKKWLIPVVHVNDVDTVVSDDPFLSNVGILGVESTFIKKNDLSIAVGKWHMQHQLQYCVGRSSKSRLEYLCKQKGQCPFMLRAVSNGGLWRIIKFNDHTCQMNLSRLGRRQLPSRVIAAFFSKRLLHDGAILKPRDMMAELFREFAIDIEYNTALRARKIAVEMIYGGYDESYQNLPAYLHMLKHSNPGTVYDLQTSHDHRFKYMFVALGVSISAFQLCMRPVIVIDGTHLKGKNKGVLFVAVTKDGNEQCFPLAVGVGPIENNESWIWFLSRLKSAFGQPNDLLIVSDQHKSIKSAIEIVYPSAAHGLCYYHLSKNQARYGKNLIALLHLAAYTYRRETFKKYWSVIERVSRDKAYKSLFAIGVHRWARSRCSVRRYGFMTSNAAESFNSRLLWARRLPICSLIEVVRNVIEKWFDERRALAVARDHLLTESALSKLSKQIEKGHQLAVRGTTSHLYKVQDDEMSFIVDLQHGTCECREFQLDQIPCSHAIAAIRCAGHNVYDYVESYYKQTTLCLAYHDQVHSLPHRDEWTLPTSISSYICLPPISVSQAGRRKVRRIRSGIEGSIRRKQVCSRCGSIGHKRSSCTSVVGINHSEVNVSVEVSTRRRAPKRCSVCRGLGHTKNKCPMQVRDEVE